MPASVPVEESKQEQEPHSSVGKSQSAAERSKPARQPPEQGVQPGCPAAAVPKLAQAWRSGQFPAPRPPEAAKSAKQAAEPSPIMFLQIVGSSEASP